MAWQSSGAAGAAVPDTTKQSGALTMGGGY
jgi:hypothetical protein